MRVRTSVASYEIERVRLDELLTLIPEESCIITDSVIVECYPQLIGPFKRLLVLPSGEETKSLACFGHCLSWLAANRASRRTHLVALGGGVIGDLVGFVAASYMRGVPYIQVPTTLLAQVDSSVGGKVGIDLPEGKNLAGAFYAPTRVWVVKEFLHSLPDRQIRNGMGEVIKYGFIREPQILERTIPLSWEDLAVVVDLCIQLKSTIVEEDEFETRGIRASLNFGHTIAHALETVLNYTELLHGEAVGIGMILEARLGERIGVTERGVAATVEKKVQECGLPTYHPALKQIDLLIGAMYRDKKVLANSLTFSLLTQIGTCKLFPGVGEEQVRSVLS